MTPRYRANRKPSLPARLWHWTRRLMAVLLLLVVAVVASLRFVNPPATAFMVQARSAAWWQGRSLPLAYRWVPGACVADSLKLAVVAAEDQKFPGHWGFDVAQIVDALEAAEQGARLRGASTLTQQTAKNLFLWPGQSWVRKGLEAGLTGLMETLWPKVRILEVYLNVAEFGPGIYGAEAAANHYFGKPAEVLTPEESALLAAVLPNPHRLRVQAPSAYVRGRQRRVREQMDRVAELTGMAALLEAASGRCEHPR